MSSFKAVVEKRKQLFDCLCEKAFSALTSDECMTLSLVSEKTLFARLNHSKIRQSTNVDQSDAEIQFVSNNRELRKSVSLTWNPEQDIQRISGLIEEARKEAMILPETPFIVYPENNASSEQDILLDTSNGEGVLAPMLSVIQGVDLAGLFTDGLVIRANQNNRGQKHWFSTENFYLDYSIYSEKQKAVKSCFAGTSWDQKAWEANVNDSNHQLSQMRLPVQEVPRGKYRTYLAPAAVAEILGTLDWGGWSGSAYKQGWNPLKDLIEKKKMFSEKVTITEDFTQGFSPKFNHQGEVAVDTLPVIERGELKNLMVNSKTAKEYDDLKSTAAGGSEGLRSPVFQTGQLTKADILSALGTGLFVSNLHYLNYSDRPKGRITGMTRFACFWVENGEIKGPIKDLRFDETVYNIFGDNLLEVTDFSEVQPETSSYGCRHIGGAKVPGLLVDNFAYTL